jgi:hypothetical protein
LRVFSANNVSRPVEGPNSRWTPISAVHDFSGRRPGSLTNCEFVVEVARYSSATVGMRTAL